jgi:hypothetical protein
MAMFADVFKAPMALWPFAVLLVALGLTAVLLVRNWIVRKRNSE